ncbi:XrtA system polysaccharide deacetylase [Herbaspirillum seropedicae]|uniref:XrtA system polysaccharide deacetylase n=1 Tax=Herbaspirillum seropedicae TaxID=964 RepID=UPI003D957E57
MPAPIRNAMTVDVEDYFQVSAFANTIARSSWEQQPSRIERNMDTILALFEEHGIRATFFTLGWIAERYPQLVRRIVAQGHELASHGYGHLRASDQDHVQFAQDVGRSKMILEDLGGQPVRGYRAPSFSIGRDNLWALDVLQETGYLYSSSIYPVQHDHYGLPDAPRFAWRPSGSGGLLEVPVSTVRLGRKNFPAGGGGFFRFYPYALSRWMLRQVNQRDGQSAIFYFHPWELDPHQPRQHGISTKTRFRHYVNLHRTEDRLKALASDFQWDRMDRIYLGTS